MALYKQVATEKIPTRLLPGGTITGELPDGWRLLELVHHDSDSE